MSNIDNFKPGTGKSDGDVKKGMIAIRMDMTLAEINKLSGINLYEKSLEYGNPDLIETRTFDEPLFRRLCALCQDVKEIILEAREHTQLADALTKNIKINGEVSKYLDHIENNIDVLYTKLRDDMDRRKIAPSKEDFSIEADLYRVQNHVPGQSYYKALESLHRVALAVKAGDIGNLKGKISPAGVKKLARVLTSIVANPKHELQDRKKTADILGLDLYTLEGQDAEVVNTAPAVSPESKITFGGLPTELKMDYPSLEDFGPK